MLEDGTVCKVFESASIREAYSDQMIEVTANMLVKEKRLKVLVAKFLAVQEKKNLSKVVQQLVFAALPSLLPSLVTHLHQKKYGIPATQKVTPT